MYSIEIGQLRHSFTIEQRSTTQDELGQQSTTWTPVATGVRAKIEPISGKEQIQAQQRQAEVTHKITIRHRAIFDDPQAAALYRIIFKGRKLNINVCTNLEERNIYTELICTEGRSDG